MRVLDKISYIYYQVQVQKDKNKDVLALLKSKSKLNAIILAYAVQLGLKVQKTNIDAQKINRS